MKEASQSGDGTVLLKSALKKQNPNSTEVLSIDGGTSRSVVYSDQSFTDTYPRQAKSIPNINFHDQRDEMEERRQDQLQRDRPLSKSSSILEREARQMGPDVLVVYDTNLSEEREVTTEEGEKKKKSLLGKAAASLKGVMGKDPVAAPIIELVPAHEQQQPQAKPNTFQVRLIFRHVQPSHIFCLQFPERPQSHYGEAVYGATRFRHPPPGLIFGFLPDKKWSTP